MAEVAEVVMEETVEEEPTEETETTTPNLPVMVEAEEAEADMERMVLQEMV